MEWSREGGCKKRVKRRKGGGFLVRQKFIYEKSCKTGGQLLSPSHSHSSPHTLSLSVCLSDLCRFAWLCLDWAQQLQLSLTLNVGVYLNKLKLVISQRTEKKKEES